MLKYCIKNIIHNDNDGFSYYKGRMQIMNADSITTKVNGPDGEI